MVDVKCTRNRASELDILTHLLACSQDFAAPLEARVDLKFYARKLQVSAFTYEAWHDHVLVGLVAGYRNADTQTAFVSSVSVLTEYRGEGIGRRLLETFVHEAAKDGVRVVELEVDSRSDGAVRLYARSGFTITSEKAGTLRLSRATSPAPSLGNIDSGRSS